MIASSSSWRSSLRASRSPTQRVAGQHVVAVDPPARGNTPSSSPSRQTTRCGTERIGTSVATVRVPVRKPARVGRPRSRSASSPRTSARPERHGGGVRAGGARGVGQLGPGLRLLPRVGGGGVGEQRRAPGRARPIHSASGCSPASSPSTPASRSTNSASRPTRSVSPESTSPAGSAVPSQSRVARHRDAEQQPVEPRRPGVLRERRRAGTAARCAASRPQRTPEPTTSSRSRSRSSSSRPKRLRTGRGGQQVEHLRRR